MVIEGKTMTFYINNELVGIAFIDEKLNSHNEVVPCVFLASAKDKVEVLAGKIVPFSDIQ